MKKDSTMRKVLEGMGWRMYYECVQTCGHKQFFTHDGKPGYEVRTKISTNTFSILLNNHVIAGPFWGYQVEEKLTKHLK